MEGHFCDCMQCDSCKKRVLMSQLIGVMGWLEKFVAIFHFDPETLECHDSLPYNVIGGIKMTKPISQQQKQTQNNDKANAMNNNRGTSGNNPTNAQAHGNRGKQLNPNNK